MELHHSTAEIFIPDQKPETEALKRITLLGIGAHQDAPEFMAFHGILKCFASETKWFGGVTCTNGAGSSRTGAYANCTDEQMMKLRRQEQNTAATIGQYGVMIQLEYPSQAIKRWDDRDLQNDLRISLEATHPEVGYTHNPADKHDTHIAVVVAALQAMREVSYQKLPKWVIGCEVWRNLDWLPDNEKVVRDVSGHDHLAAVLNGVFDSQIGGGKRCDLATYGRRSANATFFESHAPDKANQVIFGMDPTPLIYNDVNLDDHSFMWESLFQHINIAKKDIHIPDGNANDIPKFCAKYESQLTAAGGIDLQVLGIGTDGPVGLNEMTSSLASRTRIKTLTRQTVKDNARFFGSEAKVPHHVITMGIGTIMEARQNLLLAFGAKKAKAIAAAMEGPVSAMNPASILQMHPAAKLCVDAGAASRLKHTEYYQWVYDSKPGWQQF